jgi:AhpD family alkylhydroperoxidase
MHYSITNKNEEMETRINFLEKGQRAISAMYGLGKYLAKSTIEKPLLELIDFRVSPLNGCAYCLDMHSKDLRAGGETEQRLYVLSAWRDAPFYSERERAALAWAEALTKINHGVPDEVYAEAEKRFSEQELIDLAMAVIAINGWNRINIAFGAPVGMYTPGQWKEEKSFETIKN